MNIKTALLLGIILMAVVMLGISVMFSELRAQELQETRRRAVRELYPNLTEAQFDYFYHRGLLATPKPIQEQKK